MTVQGTPQMIPALSRIWEACFGDSPDYIRFFMENRFPACRSFVWLEDAAPVGAAYLLPCALGEHRAYYGYAVGVHPDYRRPGDMRTDSARRGSILRRERMPCFSCCPGPEWRTTI